LTFGNPFINPHAVNSSSAKLPKRRVEHSLVLWRASLAFRSTKTDGGLTTPTRIRRREPTRHPEYEEGNPLENPMALSTLLTVLLILVIIGFVLWLVQTKVPMDPTIKIIIYFVVVIAVILWLLSVFGVHLNLVHL